VRLHFLVEGPSEERFLAGFLPRLIPQHHFRIYPHQGKGSLPSDPTQPPNPLRRGVLDQLPAKLRAWGKSFSSETDRVIIVVDADEDDCKDLLDRFQIMLQSIAPTPVCLLRIAIEEVESWYLGDFPAIKRAFPAARPKDLEGYEPDTRCGAWELFQQVVGDKVVRKPYWGEKMGLELSTNVSDNASPSFKKFCEAVLRLSGEPAQVTASRSGGSKRRTNSIPSR